MRTIASVIVGVALGLAVIVLGITLLSNPGSEPKRLAVEYAPPTTKVVEPHVTRQYGLDDEGFADMPCEAGEWVLAGVTNAGKYLVCQEGDRYLYHDNFGTKPSWTSWVTSVDGGVYGAKTKSTIVYASTDGVWVETNGRRDRTYNAQWATTR